MNAIQAGRHWLGERLLSPQLRRLRAAIRNVRLTSTPDGRFRAQTAVVRPHGEWVKSTRADGADNQLASIVGRAFEFELVELVARASWQVRCKRGIATRRSRQVAIQVA
jgi:hypothetical protein